MAQSDNRKDATGPRTTGMKPGDEAPPGTPGAGEAPCRRCHGTGKIDGKPCPDCDGTGVVLQEIGGA